MTGIIKGASSYISIVLFVVHSMYVCSYIQCSIQHNNFLYYLDLYVLLYLRIKISLDVIIFTLPAYNKGCPKKYYTHFKLI